MSPRNVRHGRMQVCLRAYNVLPPGDVLLVPPTDPEAVSLHAGLRRSVWDMSVLPGDDTHVDPRSLLGNGPRVQKMWDVMTSPAWQRMKKTSRARVIDPSRDDTAHDGTAHPSPAKKTKLFPLLPLHTNCVLAYFLTARKWGVRREIVAHGCRLFQRVLAADPGGANTFFRDGTCGAPWDVDLTHVDAIKYIACVFIAVKVDEQRVSHLIKGALRDMGASRPAVEVAWDRVLKIEAYILRTLDYRVMEIFDMNHGH